MSFCPMPKNPTDRHKSRVVPRLIAPRPEAVRCQYWHRKTVLQHVSLWPYPGSTD